MKKKDKKIETKNYNTIWKIHDKLTYTNSFRQLNRLPLQTFSQVFHS